MLPRRNVLIFHLGALGDFVLTWPIAVALGRLHPQSRIFYVTHGGKGKLAQKALGVDAVDVEGGWHALHADGAALPPAAEKLLSGAHTVVTFVSDAADAADVWAANVRRLAPEAALVALQPPPRGAIPDQVHASEFLLRQLQPFPALATATEQILRSVAARGIGGRGTPDGRTLIHPGSGSPAKCWPLERFIELAGRLSAAGREVAFVAGEAELEKWPADAVAKLAAAAPLEKPADLVSLYQLVRTASLFIGNDSGPGHLAGIVGVPTVVVFGPGDPNSWKPLGPSVRVVAGEAIEGVTVDEVEAASR